MLPNSSSHSIASQHTLRHPVLSIHHSLPNPLRTTSILPTFPDSFNMRLSLWSSIMMAGSCLAQGDIVALLKSQEDLSTLLELVGLVDGLADTLAKASNITIFAPTNKAFAEVPRDVPEGEAIEWKNNTIAIGALLSNHVFKGVYPSSVITDIPTFAQTLLDSSFIDYRQPFSNFTGGAYNGLVKNGKDVCVISGEQTISTVTAAVSVSIHSSILQHANYSNRTSNWARASPFTRSTPYSPSEPHSSSSHTALDTSP
jgi:hypothetical protein